MPRVTRSHTVAHHLVQGGLTDLKLTEAAQKKDRPGLYREDGFSVRSYRAPDGTLLTVAGAYGGPAVTRIRGDGEPPPLRGLSQLKTLARRTFSLGDHVQNW